MKTIIFARVSTNIQEYDRQVNELTALANSKGWSVEAVFAEKISGAKKSLYMAFAAVALLAVGLLWSIDFPLNKMLWSSSFVLVVGSYSVGMFALFYYIIDVKKCQKWTTFFTVIGMNSITIYMAQRIFSFSSVNKFFLSGLADMLPEPWAKVLYAAGYVAVCWLFLYFLYKKKVFLKV